MILHRSPLKDITYFVFYDTSLTLEEEAELIHTRAEVINIKRHIPKEKNDVIAKVLRCRTLTEESIKWFEDPSPFTI